MKKKQEKYVDDLTNLYNRRYLSKTAPESLKKAKNKDVPLSIAFFDLDHFKDINDTYGHSRGDEVLREFGKFLKGQLRDDDIVFRYGGDEFICLLPNADYKQAYKVSRRIINRCRKEEFSRIRLTLSVGIASYPDNSDVWDALFEIADKNLYSAKRSGRDKIGVYEKDRSKLNIPTGKVVGRKIETEEIKESLKTIKDSIGRALGIKGEIGVGKTRLIQEIVNYPPFKDIYFLNSNLSATTKSIPYYPFREIMRTLIEDRSNDFLEDVPEAYRIELSKIVPEILPESDSHGNDDIFMVDKFRLFDGVKRLLDIQLEKGPLILCFDNINWGDEGSLELLHYIIKELNSKPLLIILIYNLEEVRNTFFYEILQLLEREGQCNEVELEPLNKSNVTNMLYNILNSNPPPELDEYIFEKSGGNPLFVEELTRALRKSNSLQWDNNWIFKRKSQITIPRTVESVVSRRLSLVSSESRILLEYAATIGREFNFSFIREILNINEGQLFDMIDEIIKVKLLDESTGENYRFSEDIIREIIYRNVSGLKLKRLHHTVADKMVDLHKDKPEEFIEEIAQHYYLSGDRKKAIYYLVNAGDRAKASYANRESVRFYTWALECLEYEEVEDKLNKQIKCLRKRAEVSNLYGKNDESIENLEEALSKAEEIGDKIETANCILTMSKIYHSFGNYQEAEKKTKTALNIYRNIEDKKGEAESLKTMGYINWNTGNYNKALELFNESLDVFEEIGNIKGKIECLIGKAKTFMEMKEFSRMEKLIGMIYSNAENLRSKILTGENILLESILSLENNNLDKAKKMAKKAMALSEDLSLKKLKGKSLIISSRIKKEQKKYKQALNVLDEAEEVFRILDNKFNMAQVYYYKSSLYDKLDKRKKSGTYWSKALKIFTDIGARSWVRRIKNNR